MTRCAVVDADEADPTTVARSNAVESSSIRTAVERGGMRDIAAVMANIARRKSSVAWLSINQICRFSRLALRTHQVMLRLKPWQRAHRVSIGFSLLGWRD